MKFTDEVRRRFGKDPAFTVSDLKVLIGKQELSNGYLQLLVHNMLARKELKRISRGIYSFRSETQIVGFAFRPFYYGLQDALSLRDIWEQETNPVVITPRRVRNGIRTFEGANYLVKRIDRKMFFGHGLVNYDDFWVPVSDAEKTLIDFVYFRQRLDDGCTAELKKRIDRKKLKEYLERCPEWVRTKVQSMLSTTTA